MTDGWASAPPPGPRPPAKPTPTLIARAPIQVAGTGRQKLVVVIWRLIQAQIDFAVLVTLAAIIGIAVIFYHLDEGLVLALMVEENDAIPAGNYPLLPVAIQVLIFGLAQWAGATASAVTVAGLRGRWSINTTDTLGRAVTALFAGPAVALVLALTLRWTLLTALPARFPEYGALLTLLPG